MEPYEQTLLHYGLIVLCFLTFLFALRSKFNGEICIEYSNDRRYFKLFFGSKGRDNAAYQEQDRRQNCSPTGLSAESVGREALRGDRPVDDTCSVDAGHEAFGNNKPVKDIEKGE